jgi:putative phosphoesterase
VKVKPHMMKKRGVNSRSDTDRGVYVVGLISDTHGLLRPEVTAAFAGVALILHAGDVGGAKVLEALTSIAPVEAVFGNVDDVHDPMLRAERVVSLGGVTIHVSHGHELGRPKPELALARYQGDVVVFGHTHKALMVRDGQRLAVNPGAAGPRRFDLRPSVARLTIAAGATPVTDVELIWLA